MDGDNWNASLLLGDALQEDERHTVQQASGFYKLEQEKWVTALKGTLINVSRLNQDILILYTLFSAFCLPLVITPGGRPLPIVLGNFWTTFCDSSNLERILPFWATFEQSIGLEHISSTTKSTISYKTSIFLIYFFSWPMLVIVMKDEKESF